MNRKYSGEEEKQKFVKDHIRLVEAALPKIKKVYTEGISSRTNLFRLLYEVRKQKVYPSKMASCDMLWDIKTTYENMKL